MKETEKIALGCVLAGAAFAGLLFWFVPFIPWWLDILLGLFATGIWYDQQVKRRANEKIIDRGDWPKR